METLDQAYLNDLVIRTREGSSNAFAELFAATDQRLYSYSRFMTGDSGAAQEILRKVYTLALKELGTLTAPDLIMPWLGRLCYRTVYENGHTPDKGSVNVSQLMNLPLMESQVMLMTAVQGMSVGQTGDCLNLSSGAVKRFIRNASRHLKHSGETADDDRVRPKLKQGGASKQAGSATGFLTEEKLRAAGASEILEAVFDDCGRKPNTIPMEALASYATYRRERFSLQRGVLIGVMALFLMLPLLFLLPHCDVRAEETGIRGLPVYTIEVKSLLPVGRVTAEMKTHALPVYEAAARKFTVEPTRNGNMTITVELINHQGISWDETVTQVDAEGPKLLDSRVGEESFDLIVSDEGIGVNFNGVYAVGKGGAVYEPVRIDRESGTITFPYPQEDWDVYIPDHIGNKLHLQLTLED